MEIDRRAYRAFYPAQVPASQRAELISRQAKGLEDAEGDAMGHLPLFNIASPSAA